MEATNRVTGAVKQLRAGTHPDCMTSMCVYDSINTNSNHDTHNMYIYDYVYILQMKSWRIRVFKGVSCQKLKIFIPRNDTTEQKQLIVLACIGFQYSCSRGLTNACQSLFHFPRSNKIYPGPFAWQTNQTMQTCRSSFFQGCDWASVVQHWPHSKQDPDTGS